MKVQMPKLGRREQDEIEAAAAVLVEREEACRAIRLNAHDLGDMPEAEKIEQLRERGDRLEIAEGLSKSALFVLERAVIRRAEKEFETLSSLKAELKRIEKDYKSRFAFHLAAAEIYAAAAGMVPESQRVRAVIEPPYGATENQYSGLRALGASLLDEHFKTIPRPIDDDLHRRRQQIKDLQEMGMSPTITPQTRYVKEQIGHAITKARRDAGITDEQVMARKREAWRLSNQHA
jgi:hypothetical protein